MKNQTLNHETSFEGTETFQTFLCLGSPFLLQYFTDDWKYFFLEHQRVQKIFQFRREEKNYYHTSCYIIVYLYLYSAVRDIGQEARVSFLHAAITHVGIQIMEIMKPVKGFLSDGILKESILAEDKDEETEKVRPNHICLFIFPVLIAMIYVDDVL